VHSWIRGTLRDWAEALLQKGRAQHSHILDQEVVGEKWREHLAGRRDHSQLLWPVLMFESWAQNNY